MHDFDQREMFYIYLSTGDVDRKKVCVISAIFVGVHVIFHIYIYIFKLSFCSHFWSYSISRYSERI